MSISGFYSQAKSYILNEYYNTPKILAYVFAGLGFIIGIQTTRYGHVTAHPYIFELLPIISGYNPILGFFTAIGFMLGDLLVKPFEKLSIPWYSYFWVHLGVMIFGVLPPLLSRLSVYYIMRRGRLYSDGGLAILTRSSILPSIIGSMIGSALGLAVIRAGMDLAFIHTPQLVGEPPDYSCLKVAVEEDMFIPSRVGTIIIFSGPAGGILNHLVSVGIIPTADKFIKSETFRGARSDTISIKKRVDIEKLNKARKSLGKQVKKMKSRIDSGNVVKKVSSVSRKATKLVGEKVATAKEALKSAKVTEDAEKYEPINQAVISSMKTIVVDDKVKKAIEHLIDPDVSRLMRKFNENLSKWYDAIYQYDNALEDFKDVIRRIKFIKGRYIVPKEFDKAAANLIAKIKKVKYLASKGRRIMREIKDVKMPLNIHYAVSKAIDYGFIAIDTVTDGIDIAKKEGKSLVEGLAQSAISNILTYISPDPESLKFAYAELANQILFNGSKAAEIVSPTNNIKGVFNLCYDVVREGIVNTFIKKDPSKIPDVLARKIKDGRYGKVIKYVYEGTEEVIEYFKDPKLINEILENKGYKAGLKGVEDKAGRFYDDLHETVDKVFKVDENSWKVTKLASWGVRKAVHGWINLAEYTHRRLTDLVAWWRR